MNHKLVTICTLVALGLSPLHAQDPIMNTKTKSDRLDWELTDVSMKKTASSMMMWGILLPIAIIISIWALPTIPATTSTTTSSDSDSSSTT